MKRRKKKSRKNVINTIIVFIVFFIITFTFVEEHKENVINEKEEEQQNYNIQMLTMYDYEKKENISEDINNYPKEEIINEYKGYNVIAKLEIPDIKLETYVLENFSVNALNISVTKFWGPNPNEVGNCCIAGHNFKNKNMFHNLKKLKSGDIFFLSDRIVGKVEYEIYDLYTVSPKDVSCLVQETNGKKEVTLITCTNDSKKRIIVKAKEKEL